MSPFALLNTGRYITCDKDDAFSGYWAGPQRVSGVIECAMDSGQFVAGVRFHGEDVSSLTAASFMLNTTSWDWETVDLHAPRDDELPTPKGIKHERSMQRAYDLALLIVERVGKQNLKGKYIVILDGNGENRRAMESTFDDLGITAECRPTVVTLELNPNVALANAFRFGRKHVRLTSGDFRMQHKRGDVCGIERAILLEGHSILTTEEKDNCVGLHLDDYCGSPSKLTDFDALYARLPQLVACAVTVAKRQPNVDFSCAKRRKTAAPAAECFEQIATYDHNKVFCDMYTRPLDEDAYKYKLKHTAQTKLDATAKLLEKRIVKQRALAGTRCAKATAQRKRRDSEIAQVQTLKGTVVAIPEDFWPCSDPGPEFAGVMRCGNALLFQVSKSFHACKCALNAVMADGSLHPSTERFWLTAEQTVKLAAF